MLLTSPLALLFLGRRYTASRSDPGAHHASILAAAASILREEGPGGYYRGLRTKVGYAGSRSPEAVAGKVAGAAGWSCKCKLTMPCAALRPGGPQVVQSVLAAALLFVAKEEITSEFIGMSLEGGGHGWVLEKQGWFRRR